MDLAEAQATALKKFKVGIVSAGADIVTIYAKDGQEAVSLAMGEQTPFHDRMGRHAGVEPPVTILAMAREMNAGLPEVKFVDMFLNMLQAQGPPQGESPLVKPQLVVGK